MSGWHLSLLAAVAAAAGLSACTAAGTPVADSHVPTRWEHCYAFSPCDSSGSSAAGGRVAVAYRPGAASASDGSQLDYRLQPGDVVTISVWKEKDLETEALVRPDGGLSFPLVGDVEAKGHTLRQVRATLTERFGRVNRPGEYPFSQPVDVMQALSLAGGATPFASLNHIVILHRDGSGEQHSMRFHYSAVAHGRDLSENVLLHSGDTVVVP